MKYDDIRTYRAQKNLENYCPKLLFVRMLNFSYLKHLIKHFCELEKKERKVYNISFENVYTLLNLIIVIVVYVAKVS